MESSIQREKVREVARIRGFGDQSPAKTPSISVRKSSGTNRVLLSFSGDQSSSKPFNYEVDHCYDHEASNDLIFSEEIKPLISSVFDGKSATVFAYGARGSGKTYTVQGSEHVPGLMSLSMSEFLSRAEEAGKFISFSLYEVLQDHVFDLLNPKKPEISVLEGANGKIVLKGLSKAIIKSMPEFHKLWLAIFQKPLQKIANEPPPRSHRGMIINVVSSQEEPSLLGRMNLVDLAGYEDKRQSVNGANLLGISIINKSLYAIHNVLYALKSNDTRVPYRESKLTRMLQESLGGMNRILMITCMDMSFSEDTIKTLSLASRSCQPVNKTKVDQPSRVRSLIKPTMTPASTTKQTVAHSSKLVKVASSPASTRKQVTWITTRKQLTSVSRSIDRKPHDVKVQARRLFEEPRSEDTKEETISEKVVEVNESSGEQEETKCAVKATQPSLDVPAYETGCNTPSNVQPVPAELRGVTTTTVDAQTDNLVAEIPIDHHSLVVPDTEILQADKENKSLALNEDVSPPLSTRLQELKDSLTFMYTSTPLNIKAELDNSNLIKGNDKLEIEIYEPRTPISKPNTSLMSPWERRQIHSTGVKESLVQECLHILNTGTQEELMGLRGIAEKRARYIIELREQSPIRDLEDLKEVGMSSKQITAMVKNVAGGLFD